MVALQLVLVVVVAAAAGACSWFESLDTPSAAQQEGHPAPSHGGDVSTATRRKPPEEGRLPTHQVGTTHANDQSRPQYDPRLAYDYEGNTNESVRRSSLLQPATHDLRSWRLPRDLTSRRTSYLLASLAAGSEAVSLSRLLLAVVQQEMTQCDLVLVYDDGYSDPALVKDLLQLPNPRQVVYVRRTEDLLGVVWVSSGCRGYLFLLDDPAPLLTFANVHNDHWHYHGRYVFVGLSVQHLEALAASKKGKKTEHLVGAVKTSREGEWTLYMNQLYWGPGVTPLARWRGQRFTSEADLFPDKLHDLRGALLKVLTFVWEPSIFYYRADNGSLLFRYGVDIDLTNTLADVLNFTVLFEEPPNEERWGRLTANGSFTGLLGRVNRSEADFGVANLYVPQRQVNIIEYSAPYDTESSCFLVRSEGPLPRWQALAFPFQPWTWVAILACLLSSGPVLMLLATAAARCGEEVASLQSLSLTWYYTFGMHLCEPLVRLPLMFSTQVFVMFLWVYTVILTIAYSTNLTAFLVVSRQPAAIETISDLHHSSLTVVEIGTFYEHQLASASDPHLQALSRRFGRYKTPGEIFPLILQGKVAYLHNRGFQEFVRATKFTRRGVSRVRIMKECFAPYNIAMGLQRHSPLKRRFDQVIGWVQQSGMIRHFFLQSLRLAASTKEYSSEVGEAEGGGGAVPLSLDHLQGIFFVLVFLWLVSIIVFVIEEAFGN